MPEMEGSGDLDGIKLCLEKVAGIRSGKNDCKLLGGRMDFISV